MTRFRSHSTLPVATVFLLLTGSVFGGGGREPVAQRLTNLGLVGICRVPHGAMDLRTNAAGKPLDSLGGFFSGMALVPGSVKLEGGKTITGQLVALPDRGFADGIVQYKPRYHVANFTLRPAHNGVHDGIHNGVHGAATSAARDASVLPQDQLAITLSQTVLFTQGPANERKYFGGGDPGNGPFDMATASTGKNPPVLPFLDPEAVALIPAAAGGFSSMFVAEEYGPSVYQFSPDGGLLAVLQRPADAIPLDRDFGQVSRGWKPSFGTRSNPEFGRRSNRGLEGLTLTPSGERLIGMMQSPLMQDAGDDAASTPTRLYVWDVKPGSSVFGTIIGEYISHLPTYTTRNDGGKKSKPKAAPSSEVLAISETQLLSLERDNLGLGSDIEGKPAYKRINVLNLAGATNILRTPYAASPLDSKPGTIGVPVGFGGKPVPEGIRSALSAEGIDLLNESELARFGLHLASGAENDPNSLSEKFEGMMLVPALDTPETDDAYLFVGADNDFKTPKVYFDGQLVGQSRFAVDTVVLVYHVKLGR